MIIKLRRGNASLWTQINPILHEGEVGIESNTNKFKFGNGNKPWNDLPYAVPDDRVTSVSGRTGTIVLDKDDVGLSQVDNTSDADKPISNAVSAALAALSNTVSTQLETSVLDLDRLKAPLESPAFTGNPTAPTPAAGDNDTSIATTAFVKRAADAIWNGTSLGTIDLDTLNTPGIYAQGTSANATLAKHYPAEGGAWVVEVTRSSIDTGIFQKAIRHWFTGWQQPKGFWIRSYAGSSNGWSAWHFYPSFKFTNVTGQPGLDVSVWDDTNKIDRILATNPIPAGDVDLDLITSTGSYTFTAANATLARHYPKSGIEGTLEMVQLSSVRAYQTITIIAGAGATFPTTLSRRRIGTSWEAWRPVASFKTNKPANQPGTEVSIWDPENLVDIPVANSAIPLGTVDLNALLVPGTYRQDTPANATLARNYPQANRWYVVEVFHLNATNAIQRASSSLHKGFWQRRMVSNAWEAWQFVASQRVDNTAGRAIYTWDDTASREQLIYGDTGIRLVKDLLINGWATSNQIRMRRVDSTVFVEIDGINGNAMTDVAFLTIPQGFSPQASSAARQVLHTSTNPPNLYRTFVSGGTLQALGATVTSPLIYGTLSWPTVDPWPTTLPGTPSGGIPNL